MRQRIWLSVRLGDAEIATAKHPPLGPGPSDAGWFVPMLSTARTGRTEEGVTTSKPSPVVWKLVRAQR